MTVGLPLSAVLAAASAFALAGPVQWGPASQGLRLGIRAAGSPDTPAREVVLENQGPDTRRVDAPELPAPANHNMAFYATRNDTTIDVFDTAVLKQPTPSLPTWMHIVLAPGEQRVFLVPVERLIYVENRRDAPISQLIRTGWKIRAEFAVAGFKLATPAIPLR